MIGVFYSYIGMIRTQDSIWVRIASVVDVWSGIVFGIMNGTELAGALNIIGNCKLMLGISILLSVLQFLYLGIVRPYKLRFDQWSAFVRALLQMIASVLAISGQFASALNLIGVCMTAYMPVEFIVSQVLRYERKFTAKVPAMISENGGHAGMISTNLVTVVIPDHTSEELADCVKNVEFDLPEKTEIILIKERSVDELGDLL
jgi:hypothetical protein